MKFLNITLFNSLTFFLLTVALFAFSAPSFTQEYKVKKVGKAFSHPWGISVFDNDEVLITERGGNLFKVNIKNGSRLKISNLPEVFNVSSLGVRQSGSVRSAMTVVLVWLGSRVHFLYSLPFKRVPKQEQVI
jgi:hypothetical protein